jgi:hypothetical protein
VSSFCSVLHTNAEYVAFLDSDDMWDPEYLDAQVTLLESHEGADLVFADLRILHGRERRSQLGRVGPVPIGLGYPHDHRR